MKSRSSGVRNDAVAGESGSVQGRVNATRHVAMPSRMKIHLQPEYPPTPSMCSIPKARRPLKALQGRKLLALGGCAWEELTLPEMQLRRTPPAVSALQSEHT